MCVLYSIVCINNCYEILVIWSIAVTQQTRNFTLYMRFSSILSDILASQSIQGALQNIENIVCMKDNN